MLNYWPIKYLSPPFEGSSPELVRKRTVSGIQSLRTLIRKKMPRPTLHDTLILGTWNIRNFDDNRFGDGPRLEESFYYLTEVISAFDIIAIQEICRDLKPLKKIMKLLGRDYDFIATDVTEGPSGNRERLAFIYNTNKVWFRNVAGEIVLPFKKQISDVTKERQFARTPFSCSFQAGWFKFVLSTVHIYYGKESMSTSEYKRRVKEIEAVAKFLKDRAKKEKDNYILVGDFNIDKLGDPTGNALKDQGFECFENDIGSNSKKTKFYDQISWLTRENTLRQVQSDRNQGVLDIFEAVYQIDQFGDCRPLVIKTLERNLEDAEQKLLEAQNSGKEKEIKSATKKIAQLKSILDDPAEIENYYRNTWRTYQMSDHLPLWVEFEIDFSKEYLEWLKQGDF